MLCEDWRNFSLDGFVSKWIQEEAAFSRIVGGRRIRPRGVPHGDPSRKRLNRFNRKGVRSEAMVCWSERGTHRIVGPLERAGAGRWDVLLGG